MHKPSLKHEVLLGGVLILAISILTDIVFAYVNSEHGFAIEPPAGWVTDESGAFGTSVLFYGPTEDNFTVNINLVVEETDSPLEEYVSASKSQLSTLLTNYQLVSEGSRSIGNLDGYELVGEFTQGIFNVKNKQVFFVENRKAYVITSTALEKNYDTYLPTFEGSIQTFQLIGPGFPWWILVAAVVTVVSVAGVSIFLVWQKRLKPSKQRPSQLTIGMACPYCGHINRVGATFCGRCGTRLKE